ncbi:MAG: DUF4907 domain-containing protein [Fluviicola sp.]
MKTLILFFSLLLLFNCSEENSQLPVESKSGKTMSEASSEWSYKAIEIEDAGWGYQLYEGARMKINQKNVPAVSGLHYFQTKEQAELAAELALEKIADGFFPPTLEPSELDSIGAINLDSILMVNEKTLLNQKD